GGGSVGQAETRGEGRRVTLKQSCAESVLAGELECLRREIEHRDPIPALPGGTRVFPTKSIVDRQLAADLPFVLNECAVIKPTVAEFLIIHGETRAAGKAEQQAGETLPGGGRA